MSDPDLGPQPEPEAVEPELHPGGPDAIVHDDGVVDGPAEPVARDLDPDDNPAVEDALPDEMKEGEDTSTEATKNGDDVAPEDESPA